MFSWKSSPLLLPLLVTISCSGGKSPKEEVESILGLDKKKDKPFAADISRLVGTYELSSLPDVYFFFKDGTVEIASLTDIPFKNCEVAQPIEQLDGNILHILPVGTCPELNLKITRQNLAEVDATVDTPILCNSDPETMCSEFQLRPTVKKMDDTFYAWPADRTKMLAPHFSSMQYPADTASETLKSIRTELKENLTGKSMSLNVDINLATPDSVTRSSFMSFILNGQVKSPDEFINELLEEDDHPIQPYCIVSSKQTKIITAFSRKIALTEASHLSRTEGQWALTQLHVGLDQFISPEQRRIPVESVSSTSIAENKIKFRVESAISEVNGGPAAIDELEIVCFKSIRSGPITFADVQKALGSVVTFTN